MATWRPAPFGMRASPQSAGKFWPSPSAVAWQQGLPYSSAHFPVQAQPRAPHHHIPKPQVHREYSSFLKMSNVWASSHIRCLNLEQMYLQSGAKQSHIICDPALSLEAWKRNPSFQWIQSFKKDHHTYCHLKSVTVKVKGGCY